MVSSIAFLSAILFALILIAVLGDVHYDMIDLNDKNLFTKMCTDLGSDLFGNYCFEGLTYNMHYAMHSQGKHN